VAAEFAAGRLSFSKVRALTRVLNVANEATLLEYARDATAGQLEWLLRGYKTVRDAADDDAADDPEEARRARRNVSWRWDDDGMLVFEGRLPAEEGAVLVRALTMAAATLDAKPTPASDPAPDPDPEPEPEASQNVSAGTFSARCGSGVRWADALGAVAEAALSVGPVVGLGGVRPEVLVHLDLALLRRGDDDPSGRAAAYLEDGPELTSEVARRLACDCGLRVVVEGGPTGQTLDVGWRSYTPTAAQRVALWARDGGCRFPGCGQRRFVDAHHVVEWTDGGRTDLANLALLCRHHHRLVHKKGWVMRAGPAGQLSFQRPDGTAVEAQPPVATTTDLHLANTVAGVDVAGDALCAEGGPGPFDLNTAINAILYDDRRLAAFSAT